MTEEQTRMIGFINGMSVILEGDHLNLVGGTFEMEFTLTVGERSVMRRTGIPTEYDDYPVHHWSWNIVPKRIEDVCDDFRHMVNRYNLKDDEMKELVIHDLNVTTEGEYSHLFGEDYSERN